MLPGKTYTPEDILAIVRRNLWLVLLPTSLVSAATAVYVRQLPDQYRSEAVIQVISPPVPAAMLRSGPPERMTDRIPGIRTKLTSRQVLDKVIDLDVYQQARRAGIREDLIERVRLGISVASARGSNDAFIIAFVAPNPDMAKAVVEKLTTEILHSGLNDSANRLQQSSDFIERQLEEARKRLVEHETKLEQYRRKYAGELPTQISSNLAGVQGAQSQIQAITQAINRDQERRIALERQIAELEAAADTTAAAGPVPTVAAGGTTAAQLQAARTRIQQLELHMTPEHPDMQTARRQVRELERKLEAEALSAPVSSDGTRTLPPAEQRRLLAISDARAQIEQIDRQVAQGHADVERLQAAANEYLRRAESGPTRDTEMIALNRDHATFQTTYNNLLKQSEDARIATSAAESQMTERLQTLDGARRPTRPFSPDRVQFNLMGAGAGLVLGLALIALREYRNRSFATDDEVARVLTLPVLAVVPLMESAAELRRRRAFRIVAGFGLGSTVVVCLAVVAYTLL